MEIYNCCFDVFRGLQFITIGSVDKFPTGISERCTEAFDGLEVSQYVEQFDRRKYYFVCSFPSERKKRKK